MMLIKIVQRVEERWRRHVIHGLIPWPLSATLTLGTHGRIMGFAHRLTERSWDKKSLKGLRRFGAGAKFMGEFYDLEV